MKAQLVSKSEYARMRDCAASAVTRAISEGRITTVVVEGREMIDPSVADIQWARNTRARADSRPATDAVSPVAGMPMAPELEDRISYDEARRRREQAEAELAELKLAELRGDLVRQADVRAALARRVASLREAFLQLPARLVPVLAADPTPARMDQVIRSEIVAALQQITQES